MNEIYEQRHQRLKSLCSIESENSVEMCLGFKIPNNIIENIRHATHMFLYECLSEYNGYKYQYSNSIESFCDWYSEDIKTLPNITPNGLVMSKKETACSYNSVLKSASKLVRYLGLDHTCEKIHFPVNIRIRWGNPSADQLSRPYASTKWHSDIWAGESSENVMLHTPIFGDFVSNGIGIAKNPDAFYPDFVKALEDYDEGSGLLDNLHEQDINMAIGNSYLLDSFLLHRTRHGESKLRGVLSFPLVPKQKLDSDIYHNNLRDENYLDPQVWRTVGEEMFVTTDKKLEPYVEGDVAKKSYADKYRYLK